MACLQPPNATTHEHTCRGVSAAVSRSTQQSTGSTALPRFDEKTHRSASSHKSHISRFFQSLDERIKISPREITKVRTETFVCTHLERTMRLHFCGVSNEDALTCDKSLSRPQFKFPQDFQANFTHLLFPQELPRVS